MVPRLEIPQSLTQATSKAMLLAVRLDLIFSSGCKDGYALGLMVLLATQLIRLGTRRCRLTMSYPSCCL